MKKVLIGTVLLMALLLSACSQNTAPETPAPTTAAATEAATVPTTVETTEPPCEHQWSEATYFTPAVCELCGEEGEKKPSFLRSMGLILKILPSLKALNALWKQKAPCTV